MLNIKYGEYFHKTYRFYGKLHVTNKSGMLYFIEIKQIFVWNSETNGIVHTKAMFMAKIQIE